MKITLCLLLVLTMLTACFTACGDGVTSLNEVSTPTSEENSQPISEELSNENSMESSMEASKEPTVTADDLDDPIMPFPTAIEPDEIDSFFDNSVFVGYSIIMHFGMYIQQWKQEIDPSIMGNALNVGAVGISFYKNNSQTPDMPDNSLPRFQGKSYNFEDLPAATGSDTIYIGLPCYSDMKSHGTTETCALKAAEAVIDGVEIIRATNPSVNIVLLSGTYNTGYFKEGTKGVERLTNEKIRLFNNYVLDYCNENGVDFLDVSTALTNGHGLLLPEFASDQSYHITKVGFIHWVTILRDYARKKQGGTWQNISVMPPLGITK